MRLKISTRNRTLADIVNLAGERIRARYPVGLSTPLPLQEMDKGAWGKVTMVYLRSVRVVSRQIRLSYGVVNPWEDEAKYKKKAS